ncbi:MAG: SEC-C domain-containing protein [Chloroflexi bacterium]|nr:SEC-C domain-containing protein [Chloroflexota bacterium]
MTAGSAATRAATFGGGGITSAGAGGLLARATTSSGSSGNGAARPGAAGDGQQARPGHTPTGEKIGRNDPCWCGSGQKYKRCHGR